MVKQQVLESWQGRAERNRQDISDLEATLARARYEQEIAQRLQARASDPESRDTWRIQVEVQQMDIASDEHRLAEHREDLALCQSMIAAIEADIAQHGG
jgi:hypothetical protein